MEENINSEKKARMIGLFATYIIVILVFWMEDYFEYGLRFNPGRSMFDDFFRYSLFYKTLKNFGVYGDTISWLVSVIALILPWIFRYKIGQLIQLFIKKV